MIFDFGARYAAVLGSASLNQVGNQPQQPLNNNHSAPRVPSSQSNIEDILKSTKAISFPISFEPRTCSRGSFNHVNSEVPYSNTEGSVKNAKKDNAKSFFDHFNLSTGSRPGIIDMVKSNKKGQSWKAAVVGAEMITDNGNNDKIDPTRYSSDVVPGLAFQDSTADDGNYDASSTQSGPSGSSNGANSGECTSTGGNDDSNNDKDGKKKNRLSGSHFRSWDLTLKSFKENPEYYPRFVNPAELKAGFATAIKANESKYKGCPDFLRVLDELVFTKVNQDTEVQKMLNQQVARKDSNSDRNNDLELAQAITKLKIGEFLPTENVKYVDHTIGNAALEHFQPIQNQLKGPGKKSKENVVVHPGIVEFINDMIHKPIPDDGIMSSIMELLGSSSGATGVIGNGRGYNIQQFSEQLREERFGVWRTGDYRIDVDFQGKELPKRVVEILDVFGRVFGLVDVEPLNVGVGKEVGLGESEENDSTKSKDATDSNDSNTNVFLSKAANHNVVKSESSSTECSTSNAFHFLKPDNAPGRDALMIQIRRGLGISLIGESQRGSIEDENFVVTKTMLGFSPYNNGNDVEVYLNVIKWRGPGKEWEVVSEKPVLMIKGGVE